MRKALLLNTRRARRSLFTESNVHTKPYFELEPSEQALRDTKKAQPISRFQIYLFQVDPIQSTPTN